MIPGRMYVSSFDRIEVAPDRSKKESPRRHLQVLGRGKSDYIRLFEYDKEVPKYLFWRKLN